MNLKFGDVFCQRAADKKSTGLFIFLKSGQDVNPQQFKRLKVKHCTDFLFPIKVCMNSETALDLICQRRRGRLGTRMTGCSVELLWSRCMRRITSPGLKGDETAVYSSCWDLLKCQRCQSLSLSHTRLKSLMNTWRQIRGFHRAPACREAAASSNPKSSSNLWWFLCIRVESGDARSMRVQAQLIKSFQGSFWAENTSRRTEWHLHSFFVLQNR